MIPAITIPLRKGYGLVLSEITKARIRYLNKKAKKVPMFIEPQHPKGELPATQESVEKYIRWGWWGQKKINGYRCQIHICNKGKVSYFTRQGSLHTRKVPEILTEQLVRHLTPEKGFNVLDAEWQRQQESIYLFDVLQLEGQLLSALTYAERYQKLRKELFFIEPNIKFLPVYKSVRQCMQVLNKDEEWVEGLVFKLPHNRGWKNDAIQRCRK